MARAPRATSDSGRAWSRAAAASGVVAALLFVATSGSAQTQTPQYSFHATAAAGGVLMVVRTPLLSTVSETPVNGGGPTAQVDVDSLGSSTGYAAFPDPGKDILSVPSLIAFALSGKGVPVPPLPSYPLVVQSDSVVSPDATAGDGPYRLEAHSGSASSNASATAGLDPSGIGHAALVTSTASVGDVDDALVSTAVSNVEGLSIGPLTIGRIRTEATMTLDAAGNRTPSSKLEISGLSVAGIPVGLSSDQLLVAGTPAPLPLNATLAQLLNAAGLAVRVLPAQQFADSVVSPAVEVTMPFQTPAVPQVGSLSGTTTMTVGSSVASLTGGVVTIPTSLPGVTVASTPATPSIATGSPGSTTGVAAATTHEAPTTQPRTERPAVAPVSFIRFWDIRSIYLVVAAGSLAAVAVGHLIRRRGVQAWASSSLG